MGRLKRALSWLWRAPLWLVLGVVRAVAQAVNHTAGFIRFAALRFYNDNCFQTASALTYTALLAMVPLMTSVPMSTM